MTQTYSISPADARRLALAGQHLLTSNIRRGLAGTRDAIRHLGYVQIDTISVVERAHHHTLWNRVPYYRKRFLDNLIADRSIFEYWAHAAAYLPMEDYRFSLPRMRAIRNGQRQWYDKNPKLMNEVLARVRAEGPLQAKDFDTHKQHRGGMWEWGPVKQAIESLFMEGELLVTRRQSFQKVFDLAERVVPDDVDTREPTAIEYAHHLIDSYITAHSIAQATEIGYQRKGTSAVIKQAIAEKMEANDLVGLKFGNGNGIFFAAGNFAQILNTRLGKSRVKILSPFDNLIIQRKRILRLFNFDYQLECYVPEPKRRDGYFVLPVLWDAKLVARMDAKADRSRKTFIIRHLLTEPTLTKSEDFGRRFACELIRFASFNQCTNISVELVPSTGLNKLIRAEIDRRV